MACLHRHLQCAFVVAALLAATSSHALPAITADNLLTHNPKIVFWNVEKTGPLPDGTTTTDEGPRGKLIRPTKIQDGSVCHNSGQSCYCTPVKYRITPSLESKWHVLIHAKDRQEAACKAGVHPTGHADSKSLTRDEAKARREALIAERKAQRAAASR